MSLKIIIFLLLPLFIVSCTAKHVRVQEERPLPSKDEYYMYILGYNAEKEGRWEEALEYYNNALKTDPSSAYLKTQSSLMLLRTGKVADSISLAEEIIKTEPDYIPALMLLGELYNSQKRPEESIKMYEKVLKIQPDNQEASLFISTLYANQQEYEEAIEILEQLVKKYPDNIMAIYYLGSINMEK